MTSHATPGTVVDTDIVGTYPDIVHEFYLVPSIAPKNATARPTRFLLVINEMGFQAGIGSLLVGVITLTFLALYNSDDIQQLTNQLCFMYYNWLINLFEHSRLSYLL